MDQVVLHYRPGPTRLSSLLEQTERLLEPFPCRPPPVFRPWFPSDPSDPWRPLRPARPAPRIAALTGSQSEGGSPPEDVFCVSDTPAHLLPGGRSPAPGTGCSPERRSWSVSGQRGGLPRVPQSPSRRLHRLVADHRLHLRQRAKWVITQQNCSDVEEAWRSVSRSVRRAVLPSCNATIRRERAEIWVFCDVLDSEQVGRFLKEALQLQGSIHLAVHRLGSVFSM